jgi:selenocysteine lyase/cysteine desulfurase
LATLAYRLDVEYGIMVRSGLHCAPLAHKTLGTFPEGTLRFSFGYFNTEHDALYGLEALGNLAGNIHH